MTEWEALSRVGLALIAGALLGLEREISDKPAGLRTYALVSQGAALFMVLSLMLSTGNHVQGTIVDPSRIASTVVQGIGFLAGGVIFTIGRHVKGLTTAAGVWVAAAVGLLIGSGFYIIGFGGVVMTVLALRVFGAIAHRFPEGVRHDRRAAEEEQHERGLLD
jgi:putative Mg2+ transporter-C (MgtC) family protein